MIGSAESDSATPQSLAAVPAQPDRARPARRLASRTRSFEVGGAKGRLIVACLPDGAPVSVNVLMSKQGSTLAGLLDAFSATLTTALVAGAPLERIVAPYLSSRFEPSGLTDDIELRRATSIVDYVGRRLALDHLPARTRWDLGIQTDDERQARLPITS